MLNKTDLYFIIKNMSPHLNQGEYVFCTLPSNISIDLQEVVMTFNETEGMTVIVDRKVADRNNWTYSYVAAWITLTVHSDLEAVGLTAAFSNALAENDISCNVVAAYHHDHIFVAASDAEKAMKVLTDLATSFE